MEWLKKIDKKKYLLGTLVSFILIWSILGSNIKGSLLLSLLVMCTVMNQYLLVSIVAKSYNNILTLPEPTESSIVAKTISFLFASIMKLVVIVVPFWLITNYNKNLILHGLVLYTFQLIIFVLSIKKDTTFFNSKG